MGVVYRRAPVFAALFRPPRPGLCPGRFPTPLPQRRGDWGREGGGLGQRNGELLLSEEVLR